MYHRWAEGVAAVKGYGAIVGMDCFVAALLAKTGSSGDGAVSGAGSSLRGDNNDEESGARGYAAGDGGWSRAGKSEIASLKGCCAIVGLWPPRNDIIAGKGICARGEGHSYPSHI